MASAGVLDGSPSIQWQERPDIGHDSLSWKIPAKSSRSHTSIIGDSMTAPEHVESPLAWAPSEMCCEDGNESFLYTLTDTEKTEIRSALTHFKDLGLDGSEIDSSNFPLPATHKFLQGIAREVHEGRGFAVLRGLNARRFNIEDNILLFLGLSSHTFHTDLWADILALQTLNCAAKGGQHIIAPAYTIYNELAATNPLVLSTLMAPEWTFESHSLYARPEKRPLIFFHEGRILFNFGRAQVTGEATSSLKMTPAQAEAMDVVQALAEKYQLTMPLRPGDLLFVNNFAVLHSREAFEDSEKDIRHLVRLWMKNEALAWSLPTALKWGNDKVFHDAATEETWEILPAPRLRFDVQDKYTP
ncbi:hypothetical protein LTR53_004486 [Teratosphaeriaceae sp. CCFEE 6253]|nr:hypothetical protein LTR53_004486 [Teratosphaeriaceae sp. CCFEE 6253]